jgi:hypothetical protein
MDARSLPSFGMTRGEGWPGLDLSRDGENSRSLHFGRDDNSVAGLESFPVKLLRVQPLSLSRHKAFLVLRAVPCILLRT